MEKYFRVRIWDNKEPEFLSLEQGNKSITKYKQEFIALSRFAPTLVANEASRCRHFQGLQQNIKNQLKILRLTSYTDLVNRATIVERNILESQRL